MTPIRDEIDLLDLYRSILLATGSIPQCVKTTKKSIILKYLELDFFFKIEKGSIQMTLFNFGVRFTNS